MFFSFLLEDRRLNRYLYSSLYIKFKGNLLYMEGNNIKVREGKNEQGGKRKESRKKGKGVG